MFHTDPRPPAADGEREDPRAWLIETLQSHIYADATGLAPAVIGHHLFGFEQAADAILSRLTAAEAGREEASRWQPIETAPKDNEDSILVCDARVVGGFHQVVWWSEGPKATGYNWYTSDGPNFHRNAFTHWMPLPKEPALTEAQPKGDQ